MSNPDFWQGPSTSVPVVNANGNIFEEVQVATLNQTVFTLASFTYTPGSHSIFVWKNGLMLRRAVDYVETSSTVITAASPAAAGDKFWFVAIAINQLIAPVVFNGMPSGGTTGQILTKSSGSDYQAIWAAATSVTTLLDAARVNIASASTVNLAAIAATTRNIQITGSIQIDGFQVTNGQVWIVKFAASLILKNNANIVTQAGQDIRVSPNSTCIVRAIADNVVEILLYADAATSVPRLFFDFRLTALSGVAVPTVDTTATSLYCTPYVGNRISLYNGTAWITRQSAEFSIALAGLTGGRPYDVFVYDNAGTPALELLVWASASARATALTTQDGVLVKNGDATRRYAGTITPTSATQVVDSERQRLVWNYYNRISGHLRRQEPTASWTYTSVFRQANGNPLNQIELTCGVSEDSLYISLGVVVENNSAAGLAAMEIAIGENNTAAAAANCKIGDMLNSGNGTRAGINSEFRKPPAVGYNFYPWLEFSTAAGVTTWRGGQLAQLSASWRY